MAQRIPPDELSYHRRPAPRGSRARRMLLEQVRFAITDEVAVLSGAYLPRECLTNIRSRVSIMVGTIVVRLNLEGFTQSDRLYSIRDELAAGRPVAQCELEWLDMIIEDERRLVTGGTASESH